MDIEAAVFRCLSWQGCEERYILWKGAANRKTVTQILGYHGIVAEGGGWEVGVRSRALREEAREEKGPICSSCARSKEKERENGHTERRGSLKRKEMKIVIVEVKGLGEHLHLHHRGSISAAGRLALQLCHCVKVLSQPLHLHSDRHEDWLVKFGYLPPSDPSTGQLQAWTAVTNAVRIMQRFAGLKDTGIVDEETMALMNSPRCSMPDQEEPSKSPDNQERRNKRRRRTISMWTRRNINWRLHSYPSSSHLSRETIRSLVFYALRVWAEPTTLEFHEVSSPHAADLQIDFFHGYHGDGYPFDGAGGAVGHAFFPSDPTRAGGVHLDAEEEWAFRQLASEGTDLFTVLVHEFGHALGLAHSSSRHSVMRPYYQGPAGDPLHYHLGPNDLEDITQLYGAERRSGAVPDEVIGISTLRWLYKLSFKCSSNGLRDRGRDRHPICTQIVVGGKRSLLPPTDASHFAPEPQLHHRATHHHDHRYGSSLDRCNTSFDVVARIRGEIFLFKGLTMWRVSGAGLVSGHGASVRKLWRGLPPDLPRLHAVLERPSDHAIIFISGSRFWLFKDLSLQEGYPQPLSALRMGLRMVGAGDVDDDDEKAAAGRWGLVWDPEDGPMWGNLGNAEEEKQEDTWTQLLKEGVSGITTDSNGSIYLFKGDSYWKFMSPGSSPQDGYPRSSAEDWLDCPDSTSSSSVVEDLSLNLSPPAGRQGLRERWREILVNSKQTICWHVMNAEIINYFPGYRYRVTEYPTLERSNMISRPSSYQHSCCSVVDRLSQTSLGILMIKSYSNLVYRWKKAVLETCFRCWDLLFVNNSWAYMCSQKPDHIVFFVLETKESFRNSVTQGGYLSCSPRQGDFLSTQALPTSMQACLKQTANTFRKDFSTINWLRHKQINKDLSPFSCTAECEFGKGTIIYLGKQVGRVQVHPVDAKISAIVSCAKHSSRIETLPWDDRLLQKLLQKCLDGVQPLTSLTSPKVSYKWTGVQHTFENVKSRAHAPVLTPPHFSQPFKFEMDASAMGTGAVLIQEDLHGIEHSVCNFSSKFN
uniref:Matrix metalloproteinase 17 n=1 Tax=Paralichthys olivaceus TaxID=8255 RepID=A0AA50KW81_PAROL|nr:matrix metalloproteinase 17 [Paralichthys olivaceus]